AQDWNFGAVGWLTMEEEAVREVASENASAWTPFDTMLPRREEGDPHLRSAHEVIGYSLQALDGPHGPVADFLVDDRTWKISHLVVRTGGWLLSRQVLVPVEAVCEINWEQEKVYVASTRELVSRLPWQDKAIKMSHGRTSTGWATVIAFSMAVGSLTALWLSGTAAAQRWL
ncbi:MAG: PRC-barrel domain-containing protein, partial [Armatimonadota bacterium]|nr:PRC-barrel domain-containing protein [Armatimonadota bacterium]